jgi:hypothetical protein
MRPEYSLISPPVSRSVLAGSPAHVRYAVQTCRAFQSMAELDIRDQAEVLIHAAIRTEFVFSSFLIGCPRLLQRATLNNY